MCLKSLYVTSLSKLAKQKMFSIHTVFKNLKESFCQLDRDQQYHIVNNFCFTLHLSEPDKFEAMLAAGFETTDDNFDLQEARDILGKEDVDSWLSEGYWFDNCHPLYQINLDYLNTAEKREKFYTNFLKEERESGLRRTGSIGALVHHYFTLAAI